MRHWTLSWLLALLLSLPLTVAAQGDGQYGEVDFETSCTSEAQVSIETGIALLHHMMYEQARPRFETAAEADAECAMAHWGVAMTSFQPLWHPTSDEGLERGKAALEKAREIGAPTPREEAYLTATEAFFTDPEPPIEERARDHRARLAAWADAQRALHEAHEDDVDAAAFYALAEVANALAGFSPDDERDYEAERAAGALLERYLDAHPDHPGLHHYLIHAYDSPELAHRAEEVARRYDQLAPETAHALHMPSHIFVRLGQWEETAEWNQRSAQAALRTIDQDEHASMAYVHALDYMMYGYLQMGEAEKAAEVLERARAIDDDVWAAPGSAYGLAAVQARYYLEQQKWEEAAALEPDSPDVLPWEDFPGAQSIFHYARGLGAARAGDLEQAEAEQARIAEKVQALRDAGDDYLAYMSEALAKAVAAWIRYERGEPEAALALMSEAADLEDSIDLLWPGEILPARELYGELLAREGRHKEARAAFERSLERSPNRRNALAGLERLAAAARESRTARQDGFLRSHNAPTCLLMMATACINSSSAGLLPRGSSVPLMASYRLSRAISARSAVARSPVRAPLIPVARSSIARFDFG